MTIASASFMVEGKNDTKVVVQFNPATLKLTSTNQIADKSGAAHQAQGKTATKLDLELVFDSTETGADVRLASSRLRRMALVEKANEKLPKVVFAWGRFVFVGSIESLNETFDFFSPEGVPLRVQSTLSMKGLRVEEPPAATSPRLPIRAPAPADGRGVTGLAQSLGDPRAGRALASGSGMESMRFPSGPAAVPGEPELKGPSGLTAVEGAREASAGLFLGLSATGEAGASFGASFSAGLGMTQGAFSGLAAGGGGLAALPGSITVEAGAASMPSPDAQVSVDLAGRLIGTVATRIGPTALP